MSFATAQIDARDMGEADRPTVACSRNPEIREGAIFRRLVGAQIGGALNPGSIAPILNRVLIVWHGTGGSYEFVRVAG
jgi:hypothetical protein